MSKPIALRSCIVNGDICSADELVRLVCAPDGRVAVDYANKLPGRGAWLRLDRASFEAVVEKGRLRRSFRREVVVPEAQELIAQAELQIERRVNGLLMGALRAQKLALSTPDIEKALAAGNVYLLLVAKDAESRAANDLLAWASRKNVATQRFATIELYSRLRSGGRHIAVALQEEGIAQALFIELDRLQNLQDPPLSASVYGDAQAIETKKAV